MTFQHIRHATHRVTYGGKTILIDPVFSTEGTMPPIPGAPSTAFNPLNKLPVPAESLAENDLVLITHLHQDHFDGAAATLLPPRATMACSLHDATALHEKGFSNLLAVDSTTQFHNITITRTGGTHGTGPSAVKLNPVSGYVLSTPEEPTVYITGDTVWCQEVEQVLKAHKPDLIICYGGAALYEGDSITMGLPDFKHLRKACPNARLIIIHTEGWNHCVLSRQEVRKWVRDTNQEPWVWVPEDGDVVSFN